MLPQQDTTRTTSVITISVRLTLAELEALRAKVEKDQPAATVAGVVRWLIRKYAASEN